MTRPDGCVCTIEQGDTDCPVHVLCSSCGEDISGQAVVRDRARLLKSIVSIREALRELGIAGNSHDGDLVAAAIRGVAGYVNRLRSYLESPPEDTVASALAGDHVVEFFDEPDFFQLRHVIGKRNPEHRWRHKACRGDGNWSSWRDTGAASIKVWAARPCRLVGLAIASHDPAKRWKDVVA